MYSIKREVKDMTESNTSALNLPLSIERDSQFHTSIYDKRADFNFHIFHPRVPMAHAVNFYDRLRLIRDVMKKLKLSVLKLIEIVMLSVYYITSFGFSLYWPFLDISFQFLKLLSWLSIADTRNVLTVHMSIKSDWK